MSTTVVALPHLGAPAKAKARTRHRSFPIEYTLLFAISLAFYIAFANYLVFHLHSMINDAYARIDNAFDVLFTRDPHLAAIGFVWPPLPSFLELPIIAFKGVWPALVQKGFAGSILASLFSAGTVLLFNNGLKWAGVTRGMRWIFCLVWMINPMVVIYASQGMSEAPFMFFAVASILVFLRWAETRRMSLLPLLGVVAGLGCLCRNEMILLTFVIGIGVIVRSYRWRVSWREIETHALLFGLPALLMAMLWIGSMAIIEHDPFYWIHAQNGGAVVGGGIATTTLPYTGVPGAPELAAATTGNTWQSAVQFIVGHSLLLFPAVIAALGTLAVRMLIKGDRVTGFILLSFGAPIALLDIWLLHKSTLSPTLRYQIFVIPYTFMVFVYILRSLKSRTGVLSSWIALAIVVVLGLSNVGTMLTLSDPAMASSDEWAAVQALGSNKTVEQLGYPTAIDLGQQIAPRVEALDTDHGLIACDSTTCFPIILNAKNPHMWVVTSDRDFQAVVAQPRAYHVEYFLVQNSGRDALNITYPGLWEDGAGFATFIGDVGDEYRLYRVVGDTGRQ